MFNKNSFKRYDPIIRVSLIIITSSLIIFFCLQNYKYFFDLIGRVIDILQPIIYGIVLAYLATPICKKLESFFFKIFDNRLKPETVKKLSKGLAVFCSISLLLLLILAIIMLIIPQLVASIMSFIDSYPDYIKETEERINTFINSTSPGTRENLRSIWHEIVNYLNQYFTNTLLPNVTSMINNLSTRVIALAKSLFNFLIGFIVAVYCLGRRKIFGLQFKKLLFAFCPDKIAVDIIDRAKNANHIFLGFLIGKIIDSIIIGVICFIGTLLLGIPYPLLIAVIIGVTNIIPFFGPFLGAIPCTIIILLEDPIKAVYFLIFIFILQQFDGNILGPKILGDTTGLSSFWVLFSILLFGGLWGVVGMIIAVPLFVVIYNLVKEVTNDRLKEKGLPTQAYEYKDIEDKEKAKD